MRHEEYTSDSICRAMGLPSFAGDVAGGDALRLLVMPSFDPEVCITIRDDGRATSLDVRAFRTMFYRAATAFDAPPLYVDTAFMPPGLLTTWARTFRAEVATMRAEASQLIVITDGTPTHVALHSAGGAEEIEANLGESSVLSRFVADVFRVAHDALPEGPCRHALACAHSGHAALG